MLAEERTGKDQDQPVMRMEVENIFLKQQNGSMPWKLLEKVALMSIFGEAYAARK